MARIRASGSFRTDFARVPGSGCVSPLDLEASFSALLSATLRRLAVQEGWRCDGRGSIDVRLVHCEVSVGLNVLATHVDDRAPAVTTRCATRCTQRALLLACCCSSPTAAPAATLCPEQMDSVPVVHGSALFSRGETQSLCTATVGRKGEQQKMESLLGGEGTKRLFVNYAFPPFAIDDVSIGVLLFVSGLSVCKHALPPSAIDDSSVPVLLWGRAWRAWMPAGAH